MKKFNEVNIEKKIGKYLFNKEFFDEKRKIKSKSPSSATAPDSPKSNSHKTRKSFEYNDNQSLFIPLINDNDDPFLFESKINNNPFLSNIKKNHNLSMKLRAEKTSKSFMKVTSKITINNNINDYIDNIDQNLDFNDNNTNLFSNDFINDDILYNERILDTFSLTNFNYNFNKKINDKDIILPTIKINNEKKEELNNNNNTIKSVILSEKENIVIEALIALDKDYYEKNKDKNEYNCDLDIDTDTDIDDFEKIFEIDKKDSLYEEKNKIYTFIDNRIKQYYNYYKINKTYKLDENKNEIDNFKNEINNILIIEKININISFFSFKSIVMGLYILVINWLYKSHFKVFLQKIKENIHDNNNNNINLDIFIELMEKYNTIKDICPFLEKDFKDIIDDFQEKKNIKFCLCELLTDLYWDYVFKIHYINNIFTKGYTLNNNNKNIIFKEAKHSMKAIIDILIVYDTSYKKNIGEILDLPYIKNNNIFLMSYILEFKKKANPFIIKNPCIEKGDEKNVNNAKNKNNKDINNKSKNKKESDNKNTENFSLEEVYKYIQGDDDDNKKGKKKNKRRQKRKKKNENKENKDINNNNEKNNINSNVNNETEEIIDPVVEEYIQYFIEFNKNNINCVKIKPVISEEWIKSLS